MPGFDVTFEPVALPDQFVELLPDGEIRKVVAVEPMGEIGPLDFGAVNANSTIDPADATEVSELQLNKNALGHYRARPVSNVELTYNQDGKQDQRLVNSNVRGRIRASTHPNQAEIYVLENGLPFLEIENPNTYSLEKTLINFTGFKLLLEAEAREEPEGTAQPVGVPVDTLKARTQQRNGGPGQSGVQTPQGAGR